MSSNMEGDAEPEEIEPSSSASSSTEPPHGDLVEVPPEVMNWLFSLRAAAFPEPMAVAPSTPKAAAPAAAPAEPMDVAPSTPKAAAAAVPKAVAPSTPVAAAAAAEPKAVAPATPVAAAAAEEARAATMT
jgi:hypothetical protein